MRPDDPSLLRETERWFVRRGLPYFVPEVRASVQHALHARRTALMLVVTVLVSLGGGVGLAYLFEDVSFAPATLMLIVGLAAVGYAGTALRARPIVTWALARTFGSLRLLLPLATRALPLLLLFVTFLFINAEVWEVASTLDGALLWVTVMLFAGFAVGFLLVRLPEEVEHTDRLIDDVRLVDACRGTPLQERARAVVDEAGREEIVARTDVHGLERANLILVLVIALAAQVLLLALSVFVFFMFFGGLVMSRDVQEGWIGGSTHALPLLSHLSVELAQVSAFLAAFSGLYFTVYAVTDEAYRDQFFTEVKNELERAVGVRAVYVEMRRDVGS